MAKFKPLPPLEELRARFDYDPETGVLTRAESRTNMHLVGKPAGWLTSKGYIEVKIGKRCCKAHRVIWYLVTGEDPLDHDIDHKDQCPSNNKFSNLRKATRSQNRSNHSQRGWGFHKATGKYQAYIYHEGKHLHLGLFLTPAEAQAAYREKAVELRGEFAPQAWRQGSA